jgi:hypothetical protein
MSTPIPVYDRVKETTVSSGTGPVTLLGATNGFRTFASTVGVGNQTYYGIVSPHTAEWEIGVGTITDPTTLSRDQVISSSSGGDLIDFNYKPKQVICSIPAVRTVTQEMLNYTHDQQAASSSWTINHNLGRNVSVTVIDTANNEIEGDVVHTNANAVVVSFSAPFSGKAYCT